jgi:hypothetical protein
MVLCSSVWADLNSSSTARVLAAPSGASSERAQAVERSSGFDSKLTSSKPDGGPGAANGATVTDVGRMASS